MTALEEWKQNADDQKLVEAFFGSPTGKRLLVVLLETGKPMGSQSVGVDAIYQNALLNQENVGYHRCLGSIPSLFYNTLLGDKDREAKLSQLAPNKAFLSPPPTNP